MRQIIFLSALLFTLLAAIAPRTGANTVAIPMAAPPEPSWARLGDGPDRALHTLIYDPGNDYYWIFGGLSGDLEGDALDNTVFERPAGDDDTPWFVAPIPGLRPPELAFHSAVYDPVRRRMIVAGGLIERRGFVFAQPIHGDSIWWLDLLDRSSARWSNRSVPGNATPRFAHAALYVPEFDAMILSGGFSSFTAARSDHVALLLGEEPMRWVSLPESGFGPRGGHALIWDGEGRRLYAYGGVTNLETPSASAEILALDLSGGLDGAEEWVSVNTETPSRARAFAANGFDPDSRLWWFHGGGPDGGGLDESEVLSDVEVLDLAADPPRWTVFPAGADGPLERFAHASAWDADRRRLVVHGGSPDAAGTRRDTHALTIPELPTAPPPTATSTATAPTATLTATTATATAPTTTSTAPTATGTTDPADTATPSPTMPSTVLPTVSPTGTSDIGPGPSPTPSPRFRIHVPWTFRRVEG